jgi:DNA-binding NarL/FixJ family response regulator
MPLASTVALPRSGLPVDVTGGPLSACRRYSDFPEDLRNRAARTTDLIGTIATPAIRGASLAGVRFSQRLTLRQNQIVAMLKIGSSNKEIAHVLGLSEGTIKVHLHRIYQWIGVSNRTQLAA